MNTDNSQLTTFSIKAPLFPGFYCGPFDISEREYDVINEELEYYKQDYKLELDSETDLQFDYEQFKQDVIDGWIQGLRVYMPVECVSDIQFDNLWSPNDYNPWRNGGHTDEINITVTMTPDWKDKMHEFMIDNEEWLRDRIRQDWTSYDGFMSFMSNDYDEWHQFLFADEDSRYVECMLTYMMVQANENVRESLEMDAWDNASGLYVSLTKEGNEKFEEAEHLKKIREWDEKHQLNIPFED